MRLQAIGDALALLPVADALRARFPHARIGAVIGARARAVVETTAGLFDEIHVLDGAGGRRDRLAAAARLGLALRGGWEAVIDLQRNRESRTVRRLAGAQAWGEFDRFSPLPFMERSRVPIREAGLGELEYNFRAHIRPDLQAAARARLTTLGWQGEPLLLLNPAGAWPTRHWPDGRWIALAQAWPEARPLLLGAGPHADRMRRIAAGITAAMGAGHVLDLTGRSTLADALAAVSLAAAVVSEDGGLMHAAWLGGVPTVAILGSSRSDWIAPQGAHTVSFVSDRGELSCGGCMKEACGRGDTLCMGRVGVREVREAIGRLV